MSRRNREDEIPSWLWFFLALPVGLILLLLYRQKRLPGFVQEMRSRLQGGSPERYMEPDSIPIDVRESPMHPAAAPFGEADEEVEESLSVDSEDAAAAAATGRMSSIELETGGPETPAFPMEPAVPMEPATPGQRDDLKIVEGIGPSIAGILVDRGIDTFQKLAETPIDRLDQILTDVNLRRLADPGTWPEQAALAAQGKWDELNQLQRSLKAGRRKNTE